MQKPHLLCCPNGLVDLRTGKLLGKPKPDDFITQVCITEYDPDADLSPAAAFFEQYFPLGAYQDQQEIVRFLQLYFGYGLSMETNQQFCLVMYGVGSNGKSNVNKLLHEVLGEGICKAIPFESLEKARGQNNDSLHEARHSRLLTLEAWKSQYCHVQESGVL
jgi:phage/plasmid-associated DNA primase